MIHLTATGRSARAVSDEPITTGSVGIPVVINLSKEFDGLTCVACFATEFATADVACGSGLVTVPTQCLSVAGATLRAGVYGALPDGTVVIPTIWATVGTVKQGTAMSDVDPMDPAPSWVAQVQGIAQRALDLSAGAKSLVTSLDSTRLVGHGPMVEVVGIPAYVSDVSEYESWGLTETGWYVFARVESRDGTKATTSTAVLGAASAKVVVGAAYVDVAVRFEVAAMACPVTVTWDAEHEDSYVFVASDLAVRNLDYRTTFYVYDITPYVTWEYGPATDTTFTAGHFYYTLAEDGTYELVEPGSYVIGDPIPADTYYKHTKMIVGEGLTRNVTYRLDVPVDCPSEFKLPEVDDEEHGCWYEMRFMHTGSYSSVLTPMAPDVTVATQHTQAETEGINMVDLHYSAVAGHKVWRFMNTHSTFTKIAAKLVSIEFRTAPTKTEYAVGEARDVTGAEVIATYDDGSKKLVTPTFAPANGTELTAEDTELTATYTEGEVIATATTPLTITGGE